MIINNIQNENAIKIERGLLVMKKITKRILAMIISIILISSTPTFAFAESCPPHTTYPSNGNTVSTSVAYAPHTYVDEIRTLPDGSELYIYGTCNVRITTYYYLILYICSKCGTVTSSGIGSWNDYSHPSCGQ